MGSQDGTLELIDLHRRFGNTVALDGLSFTVPPGQVFGFLGPNGAGKTTAMRAIVGVVSLDSGAVRWNGQVIDDGARSEPSATAQLGQNPTSAAAATLRAYAPPGGHLSWRQRPPRVLLI